MKIVKELMILNNILLTIQGDIRQYDIAAIKSRLYEIAEYKKTIIIDFEEAEQLHSACTAIFLSVHDKLKESNLQLILSRVPYDFYFMMQMIQLDKVIRMVHSIDKVLSLDDIDQHGKTLASLSIEEIKFDYDETTRKNSASSEIEKPLIYDIPDDDK